MAPFIDDFVVTDWVNEDEQSTGTPDLDAAALEYRDSAIKELYGGLASYSSDLEALEAEVQTITGGFYVDPTFITGLHLEWVSGTEVRIKSGACYILGSGEILEATADTVLTITPAASTFYYIYALKVGGALSFESSPTAPVQYRGYAKHKTGDSSRRYVGAVRSNAAGTALHRFRCEGNLVRYLQDTEVAPFRLVNALSAQVVTFVSAGGVVPPTSTMAKMRISTNPNAGVAISLPSLETAGAAATAVTLLFQGSGSTAGWDIVLDPSGASNPQSFTFENIAPSGSTTIDLHGYYEQR